jgi:hypothetical protein
MAEQTPVVRTAPLRRGLLWGLVLAGASAGALSALSDAVVRTEVSKLGAASRWEFQVRVLGVRVYRTTVVAVTREDYQARTQALRQRWRWGLAAAFTLAGAGVGAVAAGLASATVPESKKPRLTRRWCDTESQT